MMRSRMPGKSCEIALSVLVWYACACASSGAQSASSPESPSLIHIDSLQLTMYKVVPNRPTGGAGAVRGVVAIWGLPCSTGSCVVQLGGDLDVQGVPGWPADQRLAIAL